MGFISVGAGGGGGVVLRLFYPFYVFWPVLLYTRQNVRPLKMDPDWLLDIPFAPKKSKERYSLVLYHHGDRPTCKRRQEATNNSPAGGGVQEEKMVYRAIQVSFLQMEMGKEPTPPWPAENLQLTYVYRSVGGVCPLGRIGGEPAPY